MDFYKFDLPFAFHHLQTQGQKMAILGNRNNFIDDDVEGKEDYTIPVVVKKSEKGISLKKSIFLATVLHPAVVGLIWLIIFALALIGITFPLFNRPEPKKQDIEFTLVDNAPEKPPLNKKTPFRSDRNTRTGGKRDMKKKVSMPSPSPAKKSVARKASPQPKAQKPTQHKEVVKHAPTKNVFKQMFQEKPQPKAQPHAQPKAQKSSNNQEAKPHPPSARPSLKPPTVPRPTINPHSNFSVPIPKGGTTSKSYSTGPIGGHGSSASGGGSSSSGRSGSGSSGGRYSPAPSFAPTGGGGASGSRSASRGGSGYGSPGNPGGGGGAPGIDSVREPDFGPYMRELQRRIKMNWEPPKGNESKRVVLLFKIAKDGRLLSVRVFKSSGIPNADKAALNAVELTAPFRPLPPDYRGKSIDIQFTFDYNVFGASGYR